MSIFSRADLEREQKQIEMDRPLHSPVLPMRPHDARTRCSMLGCKHNEVVRINNKGYCSEHGRSHSTRMHGDRPNVVPVIPGVLHERIHVEQSSLNGTQIFSRD